MRRKTVCVLIRSISPKMNEHLVGLHLVTVLTSRGTLEHALSELQP